MHVPQVIAGHIFPQRVESDAAVLHFVDDAVQTAVGADRHVQQRINSRVHPNPGGFAVRPSQSDQTQRVAAGDPQRPHIDNSAPPGGHLISRGDLLARRQPDRLQRLVRLEIAASAVIFTDQGGRAPPRAVADLYHSEAFLAAGHPGRFDPALDAQRRPGSHPHHRADGCDQTSGAEHREVRVAENQARHQQRDGRERQPDPACGQPPSGQVGDPIEH